MTPSRLTRRDFLGLVCMGTAGAWVTGHKSDFQKLVPLGMEKRAAGSTVEINMKAITTEAPILPGKATRVMSYRAELVQGDSSNLLALPDNYLGPILRVRQGQHLKVNFTNLLPMDTTVHFHGPCIPTGMGGHPHPRDTIHPGGKFLYEFDVLDRASPFWFHPHPDKWTAYQVYYGLAGLYFITDETETRLGLDTGEFDIPLVIQDRTFDSNNQFVYLSENMSMMSMMQGFLGNRILVNGRPDYVLPLRPGVYRLRLYNGSNARIYKLAWQDGTPLTIIGTDGGLLSRAVPKAYATLAPAQRLDVWVDLTTRPAGTDLVLQSLAFSGSMCGMGGCMMGCCMNGSGAMGSGSMGRMGGMGNNTTSLAQGANFPILKIHLEGEPKPSPVLPHTLSPYTAYWLKDAVNKDSPRTIVLGMNQMAFTLNGRVFEMEAIAEDENVPFNQVEVWEFVNQTMVAHPMHIHNVQFNVIGRQPGFGGYSTLSSGFVDDGWLDTVLVMPGERVRLLVKFNTYQGMYMYHCHILEHEVMGMMRNVMVGEGDM